jgi:hypothetical protein
MTGFLIGLGASLVVILSWLGGIVYLRRMRKALQSETRIPLQRTASATASLVTETLATGSAATGSPKSTSIDAWLARAAALPDGVEPKAATGERDQSILKDIADRHFPHIAVPHPHLHLIGITGLEKRLVTWVCEHTGLPNPFDALERLTGDPDDLRRATRAWQDAHHDIVAAIDELCVGAARLHEEWTGPPAERAVDLFAEYLTELDALAADIGTTGETLRGLQAEAALVESTIVGLINLIVGSLGGYLVEAVVTAGTMTPAVAAQAQVEMTWVLKQIARALGRLQSVYTNTRHVLASVTGFKTLGQGTARFRIADAEQIARSIDPAR